MTKRERVTTSLVIARMYLYYYHTELDANKEKLGGIHNILSVRESLSHTQNAMVAVSKKLSNTQLVTIKSKVNNLKFNSVNIAEMLAITILELEDSLTTLTESTNPTAEDHSAVWSIRLMLGKLHKRAGKKFNGILLVGDSECERVITQRESIWKQL